MSIAQALGYTDEQIFRRIPEERIRHFGKQYNEPIEASSDEVQIFADNEEDRKVLDNVHNFQWIGGFTYGRNRNNLS